MTTYIALLRGINVGTHRVKMEHLRELFRELEFSNVRTYIQSGNVFFDTPETDTHALTTQIEEHLLKALGYEVPVFLRTASELQQALQHQPFKNVEVTPDTRLMIVFTRDELHPRQPLPTSSLKNDIEILSMTPGELFVVFRLINGRLSDLGMLMKKIFNTKTVVTTRFYDTTIKILQAAQNP